MISEQLEFSVGPNSVQTELSFTGWFIESNGLPAGLWHEESLTCGWWIT